MGFLHLICAIALEIAGTFCLKLSNGFARPVPSGLAFMFYGLMNVPLILALKTLDLSLVYVVWSAMGVVAAVSLGFVWFDEPLTSRKLAFIGITMIGIIGLSVERI